MMQRCCWVLLVALVWVPVLSAQTAHRVRRAVVLAGGGARGAFQVGMLQGLVNNRGLDFDIIRGSSVGAFNGAFLAMAPVAPDPARSLANLRQQVGHLTQVWLDIRGRRDIYRKRSLGNLGASIFGHSSIYSLGPLQRLLDAEVSVDAMRRSGRDFQVGTTSLVDGRARHWSPSSPQFLRKVSGSASAPALFPPEVGQGEGGTDVMVDGGLREFAPISSALQARPDEVYVLLNHRIDPVTLSTIERSTVERWRHAKAKDILARSVEILTDQVLVSDVQKAVAQGGARIYVLSPEVNYPGENPSQNFDPDEIRSAIAHGQAVAMKGARQLTPHPQAAQVRADE
jgi:NTE family protein